MSEQAEEKKELCPYCQSETIKSKTRASAFDLKIDKSITTEGFLCYACGGAWQEQYPTDWDYGIDSEVEGYPKQVINEEVARQVKGTLDKMLDSSTRQIELGTNFEVLVLRNDPNEE